MECCGILLFCPDLAKTYGSLENSFLWDFAVNMFVKLVERGEYKGISLEQCDPNQFNVQSTNTSFIDGRSPTASTRTLEQLLIVLERSRVITDHSRCPSRGVMTQLSRKTHSR
ncbi:hypothetical protein H4Q26_010373 [Puccinia striiformis f. sp. tritici PST-130]|nr:hypothetical protein H4Q26_010373 [Puccinia striiformis f. sp. tritici PST-130]